MSNRSTQAWSSLVNTLMVATLLACFGDKVSAGRHGIHSHSPCAGCAAGNCVPRLSTYGHYRTVWRRWPETPAPPATREKSPPGLTDADVPDVQNEGRIRARTRSDEPLKSDDSSPSQQPGDIPEDVPLRDDEVDPFRTVPDADTNIDSDDGVEQPETDLFPGDGSDMDDLFGPNTDDGPSGASPADEQSPGGVTEPDLDDLFPIGDQGARISPKKPMELRLSGSRVANLRRVRQQQAKTQAAPQEESSRIDYPFQAEDLSISDPSEKQVVIQSTYHTEDPVDLGDSSNPLRSVANVSDTSAGSLDHVEPSIPIHRIQARQGRDLRNNLRRNPLR